MHDHEPRYFTSDLDRINFANFYSAPGVVYQNSLACSGDPSKNGQEIVARMGDVLDWPREPLYFHGNTNKVHFFQLEGKKYALFDTAFDSGQSSLEVDLGFYKQHIEKYPEKKADELLIPIHQQGHGLAESHFLLLRVSYDAQNGFFNGKLYDPKGKFRQLLTADSIQRIREQVQVLKEVELEIPLDVIYLDRQSPTDCIKCGAFVTSMVKSIAYGQPVEWGSKKGVVPVSQIIKRDRYISELYRRNFENKVIDRNNAPLQTFECLNPFKFDGHIPDWDAERGRDWFNQVAYELKCIASVEYEGVDGYVKSRLNELLTQVNQCLAHASPEEACLLYKTLCAVYSFVKQKHPMQQELRLEFINHLNSIPWLRIIGYIVATLLVLTLLALSVTLIVALATPAAPASIAILGVVSSIWAELTALITAGVSFIAGAASSSAVGASIAPVVTAALSGLTGLVGGIKLGCFFKQEREDKHSMRAVLKEANHISSFNNLN